ncbi:MAG: sulfatase-like hydrolase/transferase, partial [Thermoanaerobaculia bacterium]
LDTTRADAIGPATPNFNGLAARGRRFTQAYATVPQTLPSHCSMLTGLYPAGHGVRENARYLGDNQPFVADRLHAAGYRTAAFVSAFVLARRFGLGRGFDVYDDDFGVDRGERAAKETTDRVVSYLAQPSSQPVFVWVHYYDPHYPYTPPEPYRTQYAKNPYLGEVASMDEQLGRLVQTFEQRASGPKAIIVVADHGEGLGDHGEAQHGDLLYQSTMHVPLVVIGPGVERGVSDAAASTRRVFHTILDFAGIASDNSLRASSEHVLLGEAMKPFLDYGWQPQVMAVEGTLKTILAGRTEVYDVIADPTESHDLGATADISREARTALRDYPIPSATTTPAASTLDTEAQRKLASLGYVASTVAPVVRPDAPRAADMAPLFPILDEAAALFVRGQYAKCIPLLEQILAKDPHNLDSALRLATAYSSLGRDREAVAAFQRAEAIAPDSQDVRTYLALHYARGKDWEKAVPLLERVVAESPDRLPAVEALALIRERQRRIGDAIVLRQQIYAVRTPTSAELAHLGAMQMAVSDTAGAIASFEKAGGHDLELGVLYLAAHRFEDARNALDRVPPTHPEYPMVLFKRAQVSVLLHEQDAPQRIAAAREHATPFTRRMIEQEKLFR